MHAFELIITKLLAESARGRELPQPKFKVVPPTADFSKRKQKASISFPFKSHSKVISQTKKIHIFPGISRSHLHIKHTEVRGIYKKKE